MSKEFWIKVWWFVTDPLLWFTILLILLFMGWLFNADRDDDGD